MLISFSVTNFLSFREKQTIELIPDALKEHKDYLHIPYLFNIDDRLLKSVGIYGHNSHGKSNLIKAYQYFQNFIFSSFTFGNTNDGIDIDSFKLNKANEDLSSSFELLFFLRDVKYRYGFEITKDKVVSEWLYYSEPKIRENYLFHREEQEIKISKTWNKENNNKIEQAFLFTKKHQLLFSVLISQDSISRVDNIGKWLKGNIIIGDITDEIHLKKALLILSQPTYRNTINKFIEKADLGFTTIIDKIDSYTKGKLSFEKDFLNLLFANELQNYEIYTKHDVYNEQCTKIVDSHTFELLKSESSGTIKYLILSSYLAYAIKQGQLIWVDEIDSKFHVLLFQLIIKLYNSPKINAMGSQMVFTTHSTILLSNKLLRRDQIIFVEKNEYGESTILKMHNSKRPIRIDTSVEKEFLKGNLGGTSKKIKFDAPESNTLFDL